MTGKLYNVSWRLLRKQRWSCHLWLKPIILGMWLFLCLLSLSWSLSLCHNHGEKHLLFQFTFHYRHSDGPKHIDTMLTSVKFEELCSDLLDRYAFWQLKLLDICNMTVFFLSPSLQFSFFWFWTLFFSHLVV